MILTSVMQEGYSGLQQSQKKMQQAAQDIVQAGVATDGSQLNAAAVGRIPSSNAGTSVNDLPAASTVEASQPTERDQLNSRRSADVVESLVEQKQQQLIFDASANVVHSANESLGKLIDDLS